MLMYGEHVKVLVVAARNSWHQADFTPKVASALTRLRRLEVEQPGSLVHLAPVLGQLPQLQHLAAHISLVRHSLVKGSLWDRRSVEGEFINQQRQPWTTVPELEQLCPQLTHLHLTFTPESHAPPRQADVRLARLLPARLQQLTLVSRDYACQVLPSSLSHLKVLQQLSLHGLDVAGPGVAALSSQLVALQQLRLVHPPRRDDLGPFVQQLAPKVTAVDVFFGGPDMYAAMEHLTSFRLRVGGDASAVAQALADFTGLQELEIGWVESGVASVVQQAASMAQLRSLQLQGRVPGTDEEEDVLANLGQCTQLTSLGLHVSVAEGSYRHHDLPVPGQLTGLQHLTVSQEVLLRDGGSCLTPLTQLTRLHVILQSDLPERKKQAWHVDAVYDDTPFGDVPVAGASYTEYDWEVDPEVEQQQVEEEYVAGLQQQLPQLPGWPPGMQQVVLHKAECADAEEFKARCWTFTPFSPGSKQISVWLEQQRGVAQGWSRPFRPCPHLPGVWELQGEVQSSNWQGPWWE
jgi:hypothetical protein